MGSSRFSAIDRGRIADFPGLGRVHGQSVGSCRHTLGMDMTFMPEGAEDASRGVVRFSAYVDEDGGLRWRFVSATGAATRDWRLPPVTEHDQPYFSHDAMAAMRRAAEAVHDRSRIEWYAHATSAIDIELDGLLAERDDLERLKANLSSFLSDPSKPAEHFVPKAQDPDGKGFFRPATDGERSDRREAWRRRLAAAEAGLASFDAGKAARAALLERLRASMRGWTQKGASPRDLYEAALRSEARASEPAHA